MVQSSPWRAEVSERRRVILGFLTLNNNLNPALSPFQYSPFATWPCASAEKIKKHPLFSQPAKITLLARENRVKKGEKRVKRKRNPRKPRDLHCIITKAPVNQRFEIGNGLVCPRNPAIFSRDPLDLGLRPSLGARY
jgi:hypothetical protein